MAVRIGFGLVVMVVVGLVTWLIVATLGSTTEPPVAVDGLGIFAVFFVAALAVERLIEPLTLLDRKKPELEKATKEKKQEVVAATRVAYLEILATGLIIGAGTKPLHELNKLVAAKKPSGGS